MKLNSAKCRIVAAIKRKKNAKGQPIGKEREENSEKNMIEMRKINKKQTERKIKTKQNHQEREKEKRKKQKKKEEGK